VTAPHREAATRAVEIYTDGACKGNPGPGGWGALLTFDGKEKELCGGEASTTNNRMELTAVIEALARVDAACAVADLHAGGRIVSTLEGGYDLPALAASAAAHVERLMADAAT